MQKDKIIELLKQPSKSRSQTYQELESLILTYPYFQGARMLLLRKYAMDESPRLDAHLAITAAYAPDRSQLFNMMNASEVKIVPISSLPKPKEDIELNVMDNKISKDDSLLFSDNASNLILESDNEVLRYPELATIQEHLMNETEEIVEPETNAMFDLKHEEPEPLENLVEEDSSQMEILLEEPKPSVEEEITISGNEPLSNTEEVEEEQTIASEIAEEQTQPMTAETEPTEDSVEHLQTSPEIHSIEIDETPEVATIPVPSSEPTSEANTLSKESNQNPKEMKQEQPKSFLAWLKELPNKQAPESEQVAEATVVAETFAPENVAVTLEDATMNAEKLLKQAEEQDYSYESSKPLIAQHIVHATQQVEYAADYSVVEKLAGESVVERFDFASETLAILLARQGKIAKAKQMLRQLSLDYPEKSGYFAALIDNL